MPEEPIAGRKTCRDERQDQTREYLRRAAAASESGDALLAMHLYLTAYEQSASDETPAEDDAVRALEAAWELACELRERSIAEYVFDKLEPYLTPAEINAYADRLQELAFMKLREFGISLEALEEMGQMMPGELMGPDGPRLMHVERISMPLGGTGPQIREERVPRKAAPVPEPEEAAEPALEPVAAAEPEEVAEKAPLLWPFGGDSAVAPEPAQVAESEEDPEDAEARQAIAAAIAAAEADGALPGVGIREPEPAEQPPLNQTYTIDTMLSAMSNMVASMSEQPADEAPEEERMLAFPGKPVLPATPTNAATMTLPAADAPAAVPATRPAPKPAPAKSKRSADDELTLKNLHGYSKAIALVESLGLGLGDDPEYDRLIQLLNARHGLDQAPAADSLLFRAPVREDALRFIESLLGEIGLPSLRMKMEDSIQGGQTLCIMTRAGRRPRMNSTHTAFEAPAVLVVEDVDLWSTPRPEQGEDLAALVASQMTRGARDAVTLIRSAVDDPDVYVLATSSSHGEIEPFFCELLTPFTVVDIENPTEEERADLWGIIMEDHPSVRGIALDQLVSLSDGLSREDIFLATREAIEEAYKESLALRTYVPVTAESLFSKLSAFYALDSAQYRALEDLVVEDLRNSLDCSVDDFLGLV